MSADPDAGYRHLERPGGRRLAYMELGDDRGPPILYCHGFPSSRREALLLHPIAQALGMRIIAADRPGYGDSDPQPGRTIRDWPDDVAALADHLGLSRFGVLGVSGGGPYALACVALIPERLTACALVCPLGPVYRLDLLRQMHWPTRLNLGLARVLPSLAHAAFGGLTPLLLARWPETVEHLRTLTAPAVDRVELACTGTRAILNRTIADAMRGGARGARRDLLLYTRPWDIAFDAITQPIDLWHGEIDGTVPVSHARWYAAHLPSCCARYLPDEGHYSLPLRHAKEILSALAAAAD